MWGKGSSGARPPQNRRIHRRGAAANVLLGAHGRRLFHQRPMRSVLLLNSSEPRRRASGRRDLLPDFVVPDENILCGLLTPASRVSTSLYDQSLAVASAGDAVGWSCADSRLAASRDPKPVMRVREATPAVLSSRRPPPFPWRERGGGGRGEVFAAGVKLRRVGPAATASVGGPYYCCGGGIHFATRARCGPRGAIRVGMRG